MELNWLQDFIALAEDGSFSRAAEARNVTQPAFSRRIRALEDWLGAPLFNRTAQGATLTEAGKAFEPSAHDLAHRLLAAQVRVRDVAGRARATLQFAATQTLSFTFFPGWIRALGERCELGPIQLNTANMAICEQIMQHGEAQFLLCHQHGATPDPFAGRLPSVVVGHDALLFVSAPGMPPAIEGSPHIAYSVESGLGQIVAACEPAAARALRRDVVFQSHLAAALLSVAREGGGVAWLPHSLVQADLAEGRLQKVIPDEIEVEIRLFRLPELNAAAERFWQVASGPAGRLANG